MLKRRKKLERRGQKMVNRSACRHSYAVCLHIYLHNYDSRFLSVNLASFPSFILSTFYFFLALCSLLLSFMFLFLCLSFILPSFLLKTQPTREAKHPPPHNHSPDLPSCFSAPCRVPLHGGVGGRGNKSSAATQPAAPLLTASNTRPFKRRVTLEH